MERMTLRDEAAQYRRYAIQDRTRVEAAEARNDLFLAQFWARQVEEWDRLAECCEANA